LVPVEDSPPLAVQVFKQAIIDRSSAHKKKGVFNK
jgi:hypothetical protein